MRFFATDSETARNKGCGFSTRCNVNKCDLGWPCKQFCLCSNVSRTVLLHL